MASSKDYLEFILDQLSDLEGISFRPMMGEYILYYQGKVVGGIYDDRLLLKPTAGAKRLVPDTPLELPYEGAKPMLPADPDDSDLLTSLIFAIAADLPEPKKK